MKYEHEFYGNGTTTILRQKYTLPFVKYDSSVKYAKLMSQWGQRSFTNSVGVSYVYSFIKLSVCKLAPKEGAALGTTVCSVRKKVLVCVQNPSFVQMAFAKCYQGECYKKMQRACSQDKLNDVAMHA